MSLQTRLAAFINAVGADINLLQSRAQSLEGYRGVDALQPGVVAAGDFAVTATTATSVTTAAGTVWGRSGTLMLPTRIAQGNFTGIAAPSAGNARLDQIYYDPASTSINIMTGTVGTTAAVTLATRTGAGTLPTNAVLLQDVLVTSTGVSTGNIRDRRPWARGAHYYSSIVSGDQTMTNGSPITFAGAGTITGTQVRLECSGAPMVAKLVGQKSQSTADYMGFMLSQDGTQIAVPVGPNSEVKTQAFNYEVEFTPSAGSHLFLWKAQAAAGVAVIAKSSGAGGSPLIVSFEEKVRANSNNGLT